MTDSASYLRRLALLGGGILLYWLLMSTLSRSGQGVLLIGHALAATTAGFVIISRRRADDLGRWTVAAAALSLVTWGLGEFGWSSSFFLLNKSNRSPLVILGTELGFFLSFGFSVVCMLSAIQGRVGAFVLRRIALIPLLLTSPIAFRLILDPFLANRDIGLTAFNLGETAAIGISYLALNLALLVLLSSRSLDWSIAAAGLICLVFGDWSIRVDKIIGHKAQFEIGSFFILFGLYSAALPFLSRRRMGSIESFESSSLLNSYRLGLVVVALSLVLVYALYQHDGILTLRILCLGSGVVAFVSVFLSQMMVERVQWFSAEIGRVFRSELEQDDRASDTASVELPVELREIYRMAFSTAIHEQRLRAEQRSLEQKRQLQSQVAHDIRSPLAALEVAVDALQGSTPTEERRLLERAAGRIRDIANDLIQEDRAERPGQALTKAAGDRPTDAPLSVLIEEVATEKRLHLSPQISLRVEGFIGPTNNRIFVGVPARALQRVLSNLIDNAVDAIRGAGTISIRVAVAASDVTVAIVDDGQGIPAALLPRLGERGFTHGKADGTGLGLHHARATLEKWGGRLQIRSKVGQGTTVELFMAQVMTPTSTQPAMTATKVPGVRVLVIDDDELIGWAWRRQQMDLGIVELRFFSTMEACESAGLSYQTFDVAFLDLHIKATAWKPAQAIRYLRARGVKRIFIATGSSDADSRGADGVTADKVPLDLAPYLASAIEHSSPNSQKSD